MTAQRPVDGGALIGTVLGGRYALRSILAQGGMATIYRGWDAQLEREVAVKVLRPQYGSDPEFVTRFRQEARSAGSLSHPNIVGVHDYGSEDDHQFIVMELVDGRDLAAVLREHAPLAVDDAVEIAIQAAAGLEAAHRRGIVHRDVKPANILLTHDGHVRVADFGIARAVAEAGLTTTGTTLGSVHYFSPEQARGEEVTAASDVYALAIVLYEMLTAHRPFTGDSAAAIALSRLSQPPPPLTSYNSALPAELVAIVMKALSLDQRARYPSAGVFRAALREWQQSGVGARPDWATALPGMAAGALTGSEADAAPPASAGASDPAAATVLQPPEPERVVAAEEADASAAGGGLADQDGGGLDADVVRPEPAPVAATSGPAARRRDERALWLWAGLIVLALALLSGIGFLGGQLLLARSDEPSPSVTASGQVAQDGNARVPPIIGLTEDAAREALRGAGLAAGDVDRRHADEAAGIVIETTPDVGETVARGEEIQLTVSRGPEPTESPSPEATPVPIPVQTVAPAPAPVTPAPPDPTPEPDTAPAMDPADTVAYWYSLVADQRFDEAYALWSDQMKETFNRRQNLDERWDDTANVLINAISITSEDRANGVANVYIDFTEIKSDGREFRYIGSWDLVLGPNGWLLNYPNF